MVLEHNASRNSLVRVLTHYATGGPPVLTEFHPESGQAIWELPMDRLAAMDFASRGTRLVTSDGCICDLDSPRDQGLNPTVRRFAPSSD